MMVYSTLLLFVFVVVFSQVDSLLRNSMSTPQRRSDEMPDIGAMMRTFGKRSEIQEKREEMPDIGAMMRTFGKRTLSDTEERSIPDLGAMMRTFGKREYDEYSIPNFSGLMLGKRSSHALDQDDAM